MTPTPDLTFLSLGAGVQSSTILLRACKGEIPAPDVAIFADTGWEPPAVYRWLDTVLQPAADTAGIPIERVSAGNIRKDVLAGRDGFTGIPSYMRRPDGSLGMGKRQCTSDYKLKPIRRKVRELLGGKVRGKHVHAWLGITLDEIARAKPSRVGYITNVFPLLGELGFPPWRRTDCLNWLNANGYGTAPKSACIGCPFHDDHVWREMRDRRPDEWADAVAFDAELRDTAEGGGKAPQYLHDSLVPLPLVDLSRPEDHGQGLLFDGFTGECEGMCGL